MLPAEDPQLESPPRSYRGATTEDDFQLDDFDSLGYWWTPDEKEARRPGRLTWSADEGVILRLLGSFENDGLRFPFARGVVDDHPIVYPAIYGELQSDVGAGRNVTLLNATVDGYSGPWPEGAGGDVIRASSGALVGFHLPTSEADGLDRVRFELERLWEWSRHSGFIDRQTIQFGEFTIDWSIPDPLRATLPDGTAIELHTGFHEIGAQTPAPHVEEVPYIDVAVTDGASIEELSRRYVKPIRDLVTLAVEEPVEVIAEYFSSPSTTAGSERQSGRRFAQLARRRSKVTARKHDRDHLLRLDMLFDLRDYPGSWNELVRNWLDLQDSLGPALNVYFAYRTSPSTYVEPRFLSLVQVIEGVDSRISGDRVLARGEHRARVDAIVESAPTELQEWVREKLQGANFKTLDSRIRNTFEPVAAILAELIPNPDGYIKAIKCSRNAYTHVSQGRGEFVLRGGELFWLTERIDWMIKASLLLRLGFPEDAVGELLNRNSRFQWAIRFSRDALAAIDEV